MAKHRILARLAPVAAVAAATLIAVPAASAALPPSLSADTSFASSGVVDYDYSSGVSTDSANGAASDAGLNRLYAVGEGAVGGDSNIAVVARHANGVLDPTFAGDGTLSLPIGPAGTRDAGAAMAVLPDHRIRLVGMTDVDPAGSTTNLDVVAVGLLPNGGLDPSFGGGDGIVRFPAGTKDDTPTHMAIGPDGRIAITGFAATPSSEDTFVAMLRPNGTPDPSFGTNGVKVIDFGNGGAANNKDRGMGVTWRPGGTGPVVLVQVTDAGGLRTASMHALTGTGATDTSFGAAGTVPIHAGGNDTIPVGLLTYGNRLWSAGSVKIGGDVSAYLARTEANGAGLQTRVFDARGTVFPASQAVTTQGLDLTVVPGDPDTLVVAGSTSTDKGSEWSAAAFNNLGANLSALQAGDLVIPVSGQGSIVGVSGLPGGSVAATGSMLDYSLETGTGTFDSSIGMGRLLVDAEKVCDLALTIPRPLELTFRGATPAAISFRVVNNGKRACGGAVSVPAPYVLSAGGQFGPLQTGVLQPGQSEQIDGTLAYADRMPAQGTLKATLSAPADTATGDNTASVHVQFRFCDAQLVRLGGTGVMGAGAEREYQFTVRNRGTAACKGVHLVVGRGATRVDHAGRYAVPAGRSVTDEMTVAFAKAPKLGRKLNLQFRAIAAGDVVESNNRVTTRPKAVRVAHSRTHAPRGHGRRYSGRATPAKGRKTAKSMLRVLHVEVAILRKGGKRCEWISSTAVTTLSRKAGRHHTCAEPVWIRASGTKKWSVRLQDRLPRGRYTLLTRAVQVDGLAERRFGKKHHNQVSFRVR